MIQTQKLVKIFLRVLEKVSRKNSRKLKKKEDYFNSAFRREKTEEKKKICVINCYNCPDCPGLQKLPTKENYFSKSDITNLKPVSVWSREAIRRSDAIRKDCFQVKSNLLTVDNLVFHIKLQFLIKLK